MTAGLGALAQIASLLMNILGVGFGAMNAGQQQQPMPAWANLLSGGLGIFFSILGIAMAGLILVGALKMMKRQNHGLAMTAAIIAMVPCVSPCCWVGLPIGIWALVVLSKPEVKDSFS